MPGDDADAALLVLCARAEEQDRLMMAAHKSWEVLKQKGALKSECVAARAQSDVHFEAFVDLAEQAAAIPAITLAGMRAKARLVYLNANTEMQPAELQARILRDLGWGA